MRTTKEIQAQIDGIGGPDGEPETREGRGLYDGLVAALALTVQGASPAELLEFAQVAERDYIPHGDDEQDRWHGSYVAALYWSAEQFDWTDEGGVIYRPGGIFQPDGRRKPRVFVTIKGNQDDVINLASFLSGWYEVTYKPAIEVTNHMGEWLQRLQLVMPENVKPDYPQSEGGVILVSEDEVMRVLADAGFIYTGSGGAGGMLMKNYKSEIGPVDPALFEKLMASNAIKFLDSDTGGVYWAGPSAWNRE